MESTDAPPAAEEETPEKVVKAGSTEGSIGSTSLDDRNDVSLHLFLDILFCLELNFIFNRQKNTDEITCLVLI